MMTCTRVIASILETRNIGWTNLSWLEKVKHCSNSSICSNNLCILVVVAEIISEESELVVVVVAVIVAVLPVLVVVVLVDISYYYQQHKTDRQTYLRYGLGQVSAKPCGFSLQLRRNQRIQYCGLSHFPNICVQHVFLKDSTKIMIFVRTLPRPCLQHG